MSKHDHIMRHTGKLLRDARKRLGVPGTKLAAKGYAASAFIYQIESGKNYPATVDSILRYAALYEIDPIELFNTIRKDLEEAKHE